MKTEETNMNVICYKESDAILFDEFRNDHDRISNIIRNSERKNEIDALCANICNNYSTSSWNNYMEIIIEELEKAGCNIVWEK